jgi:serine O-acetyltransferase
MQLLEAPQPVTFLRTWRLIRSDFARLRDKHKMKGGLLRLLLLAMTPSIVSLALYRVSHWCHVKGLSIPARLVWLANCYLLGVDIHPATVIGAGCLIAHPFGCAIYGRLGDHVSVYGWVLVGGGRGEGDVGGGPGLPFIGNDVEIGVRATILGPIRIGDRSTIGACALVLRDVPPGVIVKSPQQQVMNEIHGERLEID